MLEINYILFYSTYQYLMVVLLTDIGVMVSHRFISYNIDGGHLMFLVCKAILDGLFYIWSNIFYVISQVLYHSTAVRLHGLHRSL